MEDGVLDFTDEFLRGFVQGFRQDFKHGLKESVGEVMFHASDKMLYDGFTSDDVMCFISE
jgi:hypothetical protein